MEPTVGFKKTHTTSARIVSTPSVTSWSQAYHAGNLFAVLSLHQEDSAVELNSLGKEILETLEQEFFTLETKDLESIKQAILTTLQKMPEHISASLAVAALQPKDETVLYVYGYGNTKILIQRKENVGTILPYNQELTSSSGFLQDGDTIILETKKFAEIIPHDLLVATLHNGAPADVAETLAPKVHEASEGEATALLISFKKPVRDSETPMVTEPAPEEPMPSTSPPLPQGGNGLNFSFLTKYPSFLMNKLGTLQTVRAPLTHSKKLFLTIAVIIAIVLAVSIFFALKSQQDKKTKALFAQLYPKASQKYEQGQSLLDLNKNLARDDFEEAKKILLEGKSKFKEGSEEEKQMSQLLTKVEAALEAASGTQTVQPQQVDTDKSPLLQAYSTHPTASYVAQDEKSVYVLTTSSISSIDKTGTSKTIIKNDNHWTDPGGFGTYLGNIYVLDKKAKQIVKFVAVAFAKSNYLPNANSELSRATSLTIDGSIYVLLENGDIKKFTKGAEESFNLSGLDKPLNKPSRIFTDTDTSNIYILDKGNSRIIVFGKNGSYQSQYQADILKSTIDFDLQEKDKKIYVLVQGKIYEIEIK